jgi:Rrf2 family protein
VKEQAMTPTLTTALRISEDCGLAMHVMVLLAQEPAHELPLSRFEEVFEIGAERLLPVFEKLAAGGLVTLPVDVNNMYTLAKHPEIVTLLDVYEVVDGILIETRCFLNPARCDGKTCMLGMMLGSLNDQVRDYLAETSLADVKRLSM